MEAEGENHTRLVNSTVSAGGSPSRRRQRAALLIKERETAYLRSQRCKEKQKPRSNSKVGIFTILIYVQGEVGGRRAETLRSNSPSLLRACFPRIEVMGHPGPWRACGRTGGVKDMILSEEHLAICNSFSFLSCDSSEEGQNYYFIM